MDNMTNSQLIETPFVKFFIGCHQQIPGGDIKTPELHVPGFQHLGWLLPQHVDLVPELYFLFIALMMGQPIKLLPADSKVGILLKNLIFPPG